MIISNLLTLFPISNPKPSITFKSSRAPKVRQPILKSVSCCTTLGLSLLIFSPNVNADINYLSESTAVANTDIGQSANTFNWNRQENNGNNGNNRNSTQRQGEVDTMHNLIVIRQQDYADRMGTVVEERRIYRSNPTATVWRKPELSYPTPRSTEKMDINEWLAADSLRQQEAFGYQRYLASQIGMNNLPPLSQLLLSARDWYDCGQEPYEVPPRHLWQNNVNTLALYAELKRRGIIPASAEIRSVYRNPSLNACAGGAAASQHVHNTSIDIWVPEYENNEWMVSQLQDNLCAFRLNEGNDYNLGLGLYAKNAYHLDTHRSRIWGVQHTQPNSPCRIALEPSELEPSKLEITDWHTH